MEDGFSFDTRELEQFEKDLLSLAKEQLPKESKKFLKKNAGKLTTVNKNTFKSSGAAAGSGVTEAEILKKFKAGKVYEYNGDLSCRAYASHPLVHLMDLGFIHKGGFKIKSGAEVWVPGYHFMKGAQKNFQDIYYKNTQKFIDDMIEKGLR